MIYASFNGRAIENVKDQMISSTLKLNIEHFADLNDEAEYNLQIFFKNIIDDVCDGISICDQTIDHDG